jgi:hypothetical protein
MLVSRVRGDLVVLWAEADPFTGEDEPPRLIEWPWDAEFAHACDVFGVARELRAANGRLSIGVSVTPLFVWA